MPVQDLFDGEIVARLRALQEWARQEQRVLCENAARDAADEIERLRAAGRNALNHMCRAVAPDDAYTDAVDQLDAVLNPT